MNSATNEAFREELVNKIRKVLGNPTINYSDIIFWIKPTINAPAPYTGPEAVFLQIDCGGSYYWVVLPRRIERAPSFWEEHWTLYFSGFDRLVTSGDNGQIVGTLTAVSSTTGRQLCEKILIDLLSLAHLKKIVLLTRLGQEFNQALEKLAEKMKAPRSE